MRRADPRQRCRGHTAAVSEDTQLLRRLVAEWKATRDPALEPWIDKAGAAIAHRRGRINNETTWHELATGRDLGDVDRLLGGSWKLTDEEVRIRIKALAAWPPDPRISRRLAMLGVRYRGDAHDRIHHAISSALERSASARLLPWIAVVESHGTQTTQMTFRRTREAIEQLTTRAANPDLLARAEAELGSDADLDALFDQLARAPGDLALRAVIADRLQRSGDPRGEFIALQLDGSVQARKQASRMLETHIDAWTGPLPGVDPDSRRFERGFLTAAYVGLQATRIAKAVERFEWTTIEELGLGGMTAHVPSLIARMPLLRRLAAPRWVVEQLVDAGVGKTLDTLVVSDGYVPPHHAFPALSTLVWFETWSPPGKRIKAAYELGIGAVGQLDTRPDDMRAFIRAAGTLPVALRFSIGEQPRGLIAPGFQIRIGEGRALVQHSGRRGLDELFPILDVVGKAIVCAPTPALRARLPATADVRDERFDLFG